MRRVAAAGVLALLAAPGAASGATPSLGQFVGHAGKTAIGVALGADGSLAYACDGKRIGTWFKGAEANGRRLVLRGDGAKLTLAADGDRLEAKLGDETATLRAATGRAGLYRSENRVGAKSKLAGWVVQRSGKQVGVLASGSQLVSAPKLSTTTLLAGSLVVAPIVDPSDPQPLVIDLGHDGINVSGTATTAALGGSARSVRWTVAGDDDAFIGVDADMLRTQGFALSRSGLLLARSGLTVTRNGTTTTATDGLSLLRLLDGNQDRVLNSADPAFAAVRIFTDGNGDGDFADRDSTSDARDSISELGEEDALMLQAAIERKNQTETMISNALKAGAQTSTAVIRALKG